MMPGTDSFIIQAKHKFEINTTPDATEPTWVRVGAGFSSVEPSPNEETDDTSYLDGDGNKSTTVTGGQLTLAFSGHRKYDDPAQNFIASKALKYGSERETQFRWTDPSGVIVEGDVTMTEISLPSGDANAKGEFGVTIAYNGVPKVTETP
ncbi:capsid protein [Bacillus sp. SA116]|nr:hypothetical protein [Bacillus subtilis]AGE62461.1 hypothetical protein C663_0614 [Bacillus subtilis XF-1]TPF12203.1 capsid protein [Bacillus subtilis]WEY84789.1 capsid protein [Bacillus subtilis]WEZ04481.1 capsid protein [Bacillus subtilis]WGD63135.1 capsid protein [Bacillus subtilis]